MRQRTKSRAAIAACLAVTACFLSEAMRAQAQQSQGEHREQQPVRQVERRAHAMDAKPLPPRTSHGLAQGPFYAAPTDDELDFAPYRDSGSEDGESYRRHPFGHPYTLSFAGGDHTPAPGVDPRVRALETRKFFGYVMIRGRMTAPAKLRKIDELGVRRIAAHTWQSWVAEIPTASVDALAALPFVHWVGLAQPKQKLHPLLQERLANARPDTRIRIDVNVFASDRGDATEVLERGVRRQSEKQDEAPLSFEIPNGPMHRTLTGAGLEFEDYTDTGNVFIFRGSARPDAIRRIRDLNFVASIELALTYEADGDQTQAMIGQDKVRAQHGGGPITVGVIDSGLWSPSIAQRHRDFRDKWLVAWDQVGNGAYNDERGHGTAVTGVMVGSGTADARYRGGAPEIGRAATRRLFIGRLLDKDNKAVGSSLTLYRALAQDYRDGSNRVSKRPRVINNSWGSSPPVGRPWIGTESGARRVDDFVYNGGQTYVFSSGNRGPSQAAGVPAVAKNTICVGSCWDNYDSTVRPGDLRPTSAGGTADGRRKPDVLAPGRWVCTTVRNSTNGYGNFWGTSFASPHVTGAVASLIDHHRFLDYQPAQIKAMFCAAAEWQGSAGSTTGYFGTRLGHGLVDASKMHGDAETGWFSGTARTPFTRSGQWVYWDVTVPSSAQHVSVFLCWDEPAASANATKARVNDVRAYVDVAPFSSTGNSGEYSISSSSSNVISKVGTSWATVLRGKKVRIKAHAHSIKSSARLGMTIMWMTKSPNSSPLVDVGVTKSVMKPGASFQMAGKLGAPTTGHHFDNGVLRPTLPSGFTVTQLRRVGLDNVAQIYTGSGHPSFAFPSLTNGMTVGQGARRDVLWTITAPTSSGTYTVGVQAWADPGNRTLRATRSVCVDGLRPPKVAGLTSSSHFANRWYRKNTVHMLWRQTTDSGCSGTRGYAYSVTRSPAAPTTLNIPGKSNTMKSINLTSGTKGWYFNVKAVDFADNVSSSTSSMGPFLIDTVKPTVNSFAIDGGASRTKTLQVTLRAQASDTYSGVDQMRFSSNGASWSAWVPYTTNAVGYNLASHGGNTQNGPKQVWVEVRDKAGNSAVRTDTIIYDSVPPVVSSVLINGGASATSSTKVQVLVKGVGIPAQMRFSSDDATWSAWQAYSEAAQNYDLTNYGGTSATGTKRVHCQMRDAVGNVSASRADSILYYAIPSIDKVSTSSVPTVHDTTIQLTGKFADVTRLSVNGKALPTGDPHAWIQGSWTKRSSSTIELRMPQNTDAGLQVLRVGNPAFASAATAIQRVHPSAPTFHCQPRQAAGKRVDLVLHRGSFPTNGLAMLSLSVSPTPLVIPNLIQLRHGGNTTTVIDPSFLTLPARGFDATKRSIHWSLPTLVAFKGIEIYFQPLLFDVQNPFKTPITTAPMDSTKLD